MYGENFGTGTLRKVLARMADGIRAGEAYGGGTMAESCRELMEGAIVLWEREVEDERDELLGLVRTMAHCMRDDRDCDRCAMNGHPMRVEIPDTFACDGLRDRLRGLGVCDG